MTTPLLARGLRPGATVALVAPASPYDADRFHRGVARLQALGYRVRPGAGHRAPGHLVAGSLAARLDELHGAFADPAVDAVMAIRGGYGSMALLPHLDWALLAAHPKPLVGLSDLTPLLNAAFDRTGLVTFHGPMVVGFGGDTDGPSIQRLLDALTRPVPLPDLVAGGTAAEHRMVPGTARGRLAGGNLALVASTLGTPYAIRPEGRILLLEDVGEPPYRIHRELVQLRLAGVLDRCAAVGFGEMVGCGVPDGARYTLRQAVADAMDGLSVPVIWGLPFGHGKRNWTFPVGVDAELDAGAGQVRFLEPAVTAADEG